MAGRPKDLEFCRALKRRGMVDSDQLQALINKRKIGVGVEAKSK